MYIFGNAGPWFCPGRSVYSGGPAGREEGGAAVMGVQMVAVPQDMQADFCLRCNDNSLILEGIFPGDILFIRAGDVTDGDLAAVSLDGENHVGNVWRTEERLCITPRSPHYKSKIFAGEDLTRAHVVGAVVGWTHWHKARRPMEENSGKEKEENKQ